MESESSLSTVVWGAAGVSLLGVGIGGDGQWFGGACCCNGNKRAVEEEKQMALCETGITDSKACENYFVVLV